MLLQLIGKPNDSDLGGCFEYVKAYCDREEKPIGRTCMQLLERIGRAVSLILDTADELASAANAQDASAAA